eukprot:TRINITY_DN25799_c0_g1_i4.p1 TRINITY_DN25799_c0_g1~~TRINITY_DN25799_c0_g1_i4.p1  ORF type:complete len:119 (-),score=13.23 TRINITY_DN25799_c0_g1_i4:439-795(-)
MPYKPSEDYVARCRKTAQQQVALGGYRLSSWLNALAEMMDERTGCALQADDLAPVAVSEQHTQLGKDGQDDDDAGMRVMVWQLGLLIGCVCGAALTVCLYRLSSAHQGASSSDAMSNV